MNPFRRPGVRYGTTPVPETPYQRAGQAWDERMGSIRTEARAWRMAAFAGLGLSLTLAGAIAWVSGRSQVRPWIVEVDGQGRVQTVAPADGARPTDPQLAARLGQWIVQVRSLPNDPVILRENWLAAYALAGEDAGRRLNEFAREADPFAAVGQRQVSVEVGSVLRVSPDSFRIAWTERRYEQGRLIGAAPWQAVVGVQVATPRTAEDVRGNPLGLRITAFDWSREGAS